MRARITLSFITLALLSTGLISATASAEEPVTSTVTTPAAVSPAVPVTPGRPHGASYDPHGKLDPETQIEIALKHKAEGRPPETLHTLSMAIDKHPNYARLYAVRGSLLLEEGRVTPALADLEKAVTLEPTDAEALTNRAQAYRQFGRADQALADLDRALAINSDLLPARFNRGALRYGTRELDGALEDFDYCIALDPHLPGPYFNRAAVRDALGDQDAAIADLERFLQISENEAWNEQAKEMLEVLRNPERVEVAPPPNPHQ
jgi:tetratricopeptide (TPR) repeat protein